MIHLTSILAITILWFIPGIIIREIKTRNLKLSKAEAQAKAIARLYPKETANSHN